MHYYKRHLGDYARKAGHLSMLEHGAYNLILDAYYDREVPPTRAEAIRFARARSAEEIAAVDVVLAEFFTESDGRYVQDRVEAEFAEVAVHAEKNRDNGKKGGRPRKSPAPSTDEKPKKTQSVISDNPNETQTKGNPLIQESITEQEQKALVQPTAARSPFLDFWAAYPNKKGKQEAEKTWKRRKLDSSCAELIAHVHLMAATDSDWRRGYVPMGSTYLNQARWEDVPKRPPDSGPVAQSKTLTAIQTLEDMKHGLAGYGTSDGFPETALLGVGSHPGD